MSELRAPDPTLDAMGDRFAVVSIEDGAMGGPATAHQMDPGSRCDPADAFGRTWSRCAKWFAVPCRECFPESPQPGRLPCRLGEDCVHTPCHGEFTSHLAWQTGGAA